MSLSRACAMCESPSDGSDSLPTEAVSGDRSAGSLHIPAQPKYLALIGTVVRWYAEQAGLDEEACHELEVAVDEASTNVVSYAFPEDSPGEMAVKCATEGNGLAVTIQDNGKPFTPSDGIEIGRKKRETDPSTGGMGLFMINQLTDEVRYEWNERDGNQFTLVKHRKT